MLPDNIRSEVFLRHDLEAILAALAVTAAASGGPGPHDLAYRRGFAAALVAEATAIHSNPAALAELATRPGVRVIWPAVEVQR
jgi:hypothetical protein